MHESRYMVTQENVDDESKHYCRSTPTWFKLFNWRKMNPHVRHTNAGHNFSLALILFAYEKINKMCDCCENCVLFLWENIISGFCISWSRHDMKKSHIFKNKIYGSIFNHSIYFLFFLSIWKYFFHHFKLSSKGKSNETFLIGSWCFHFSSTTLHQQLYIYKRINIKLNCLRHENRQPLE